MRMVPVCTVLLGLMLAVACATVSAPRVPSSEIPKDGPQLYVTDGAGGLYDQRKGFWALARKLDDVYYVAPGQWCRFEAIVVRPRKIRLVTLFNKVDIWKDTATGKVVHGAKIFEYDLRQIEDCCVTVFAPWSNSFAFDPGWFATFTMWALDESGASSNSVILGPIVVRGEGGPSVPKAW